MNRRPDRSLRIFGVVDNVDHLEFARERFTNNQGTPRREFDRFCCDEVTKHYCVGRMMLYCKFNVTSIPARRRFYLKSITGT